MVKVHKATVSMHTRDGVRLDADLYRPDAAGDFPVLLMRQPYGRAIASTVVYAHPAWYAAQGYLVVIQDVRGRGSSAGEFVLFEHEIADGADTVNWAAALPGSTGAVGMYGFSYQGMTQLYAAIERPSALKALCPAMLAYDLYHDWAYEGGAFCLQTNLGWALQLAAETARLQGDAAAYRSRLLAARHLPLSDPMPARPEIITQAPDSFYHQWLDRPASDDYWRRLSPATYLAAFDLPMLHIGGWFDPYLRGTLNLYEAMTRQSQQPQHLIVGPWAHLPWGRQAGAIEFGPAAASLCDRAQIRWFDHFLKGKPLEVERVAVFELGSHQWRDRWGDAVPMSLYLTSTGLAGIRDDDGQLLPAANSPATDWIVHDPWRPVPALGGHAALPAGMFDRSGLDCRTDILTYTTPPHAIALHLAGNPVLALYCTADAPSFDLCAVLSVVHPNGRVYNLAQGYRQVKPADPTLPVTIPLQAVCAAILPGQALRLSLSAACFPAYPVNPGTGESPTTAALMAAQLITVTVLSGGDRASHLLLPVAEAGALDRTALDRTALDRVACDRAAQENEKPDRFST